MQKPFSEKLRLHGRICFSGGFHKPAAGELADEFFHFESE
jgi:hypothetical protein